MTLVRVAKPIEYPITVSDVKANSRIDGDAEDMLISALIGAALDRAEMETGRAFAPQSWRLVMDQFPNGDIIIPLGPITDQVEIEYDNADGLQVVAPDDYSVDTASADGRLVPVDGWPESSGTVNSVRVLFEVGYDCPEDVKQALLLMIGHWYEHREDATETVLAPIPYGVAALLGLHRRMFV